MNEKSKKSHSRYRKSPNDFAKTVIVFVVTAIIIIVGAIIAVNKPACNLVHKLESDMPIGIRDIEIDQSQNILTPIDSESLAFGSYIANITCEKRGIEVPAYYGSNRVSFRYGAGVLNDEKPPFSAGKNTFITGYDETYFMSLKYVQKGDKFVITTSDKTINYKVIDTFIGENNDSAAEKYNDNLILKSIFSDFGENSAKRLYVICEKTSEEVNAK